MTRYSSLVFMRMCTRLSPLQMDTGWSSSCLMGFKNPARMRIILAVIRTQITHLANCKLQDILGFINVYSLYRCIFIYLFIFYELLQLLILKEISFQGIFILTIFSKYSKHYYNTHTVKSTKYLPQERLQKQHKK